MASIGNVNRPRASLAEQNKRGTFGDLTALALHGDTRLRGDDLAFLQRFSSGFARAVPTAKLDSVTFNIGDRIAAWLSGTGTELRQLKEMQLDDPLDSDGSRPRQPSTVQRIRRRSLVLMGAEETSAQKQREHGVVGSGEFTSLPGPKLIRRMAVMMLRAHYEAIVLRRAQGRATAREVRQQIEVLRQAHSLSFLDRCFLRVTDSFSEEDRLELLLGRQPGVEKSEDAVVEDAITAASVTPRLSATPRLSLTDLAAGRWIPEPSGRASGADEQRPSQSASSPRSPRSPSRMRRLTSTQL